MEISKEDEEKILENLKKGCHRAYVLRGTSLEDKHVNNEEIAQEVIANNPGEIKEIISGCYKYQDPRTELALIPAQMIKENRAFIIDEIIKSGNAFLSGYPKEFLENMQPNEATKLMEAFPEPQDSKHIFECIPKELQNRELVDLAISRNPGSIHDVAKKVKTENPDLCWKAYDSYDELHWEVPVDESIKDPIAALKNKENREMHIKESAKLSVYEGFPKEVRDTRPELRREILENPNLAFYDIMSAFGRMTEEEINPYAEKIVEKLTPELNGRAGMSVEHFLNSHGDMLKHAFELHQAQVEITRLSKQVETLKQEKNQGFFSKLKGRIQSIFSSKKRLAPGTETVENNSSKNNEEKKEENDFLKRIKVNPEIAEAYKSKGEESQKDNIQKNIEEKDDR